MFIAIMPNDWANQIYDAYQRGDWAELTKIISGYIDEGRSVISIAAQNSIKNSENEQSKKELWADKISREQVQDAQYYDEIREYIYWHDDSAPGRDEPDSSEGNVVLKRYKVVKNLADKWNIQFDQTIGHLEKIYEELKVKNVEDALEVIKNQAGKLRFLENSVNDVFRLLEAETWAEASLEVQRLKDLESEKPANVITTEPGYPTEIAEKIFTKHLPAWIKLFLEKNADYGDASDDLGVQGQFSDLHRKLKKLRRALWDGEKLTGEQPPEILLDLIGHCFLTLELIEREEKERSQPDAD